MGLTGVLPFTFRSVWRRWVGRRCRWIPLLLVAVVATGLSSAASITAAEMLVSRLASFVGLIEVVAAAVYSCLLLGEALTVVRPGGVLILVGTGFVRSENRARSAG